MAYNVLVCSTRKEQDLAKNLADSLRDLGVLSVQQETLSKPPLSKASHDRLQRADEVIVLLTEKSMVDPWVLYEMGAASSLHKRVTPILVGIGSSDLPAVLRQMQHVSYADLRNYLAKLKKRVAPDEGDKRVA
ncbi:MAG: hypothetical protein QOJ16_3274 [Acidobacteriota bacterium]|jgi:hypothetical protein|nr:hypothetical protein [Acidobacteriota bacterium]